MSGDIREYWKPPAKLWVRIKGRKVAKRAKEYFFTSSPVPNSDNLNIKFTDGYVVEVDQQFANDNDWINLPIQKTTP